LFYSLSISTDPNFELISSVISKLSSILTSSFLLTAE
jgi:hypothetical protein